MNSIVNHSYSMEYAFMKATESSEFDAAKELFIEYGKTLDFDLCFQNFDYELNELNFMYNEPDGGLILIKESLTGNYVGCAGIRKIEDRISELKRMFIQECHRHKGLGEQLLTQSINLARDLGYKKIRLDTVAKMASAIKLYRAKGFKEIDAYTYNPRSDVIFFELELL
jgi:putative acetyltransferase